MRRFLFSLTALIATTGLSATTVHADTTALKGEVKQFTSPDDLNLDPSRNVIAVNVFGDEDLDVNGVTFREDQSGAGEVEKDGITVFTIAPNMILNWAAAPEFTGADEESARNLGRVMESIRWNGAPNPVSIEVDGLTTGVLYELQLLFNEGRDRVRMWDISIEDELVVDNITSAGNYPDDFWDFDSSAVYTVQFQGPGDGTLNVEMAQDLGGEAPEDTGDNNPILGAIVITLVDTSDSDGDGMPDVYEEANGLDPEANDAALDKDGDGISNLEEFENGTKPNNSDSDGDGLSDGAETGTGTFVSAGNTGTNPRKADTDGDGLSDGDEVTEHKSDPNKLDTDGDGAEDGFEVALGSDPADANSLPGIKVTIGTFEGGDEGEGLDLDGQIIYAVNASSFGAAGKVRDADFTDVDGTPEVVIDAVNDIPNWGSAMDFGDTENDNNLEDVMAGINWTARPGGVIITISGLIPGSPYKIQTLHAERCCDRGWYTYLDGTLIFEEFNPGRLQLDIPLDDPSGAGDAGNTNGAFMAIEFTAGSSTVELELNGTEVFYPDGNAILNGLTVELLDDTDADGDGMLDVYEIANGLDTSTNDSALDKDGDGISNIDEFKQGTLANNDDSDGDGLKDGVETNTGTWVSASNTGTNPSRKDSDGDRLNDGVETNTGVFVSATNTGTNPNKADTDGDGDSDGNDPDPLDPEVFTPSGTVILTETGKVVEFFGPDDLHFDPSKAVIAVDSFGDEDREVNGVLFQTDRDDGGVVERDGVTVTTTATHSIDGWAAAPNFVGGQGDSALNLSEIMSDIRWEAAPNPVTIDIEGLVPGASYEIQILVNEGGNRARQWDIGVEDELVVDNFSSEGTSPNADGGGGGVWSPDNSFAYVDVFTPSADGVLNIVMQQDIEGGQGPLGSDNNPILQGIVVHSAAPGAAFEIIEVNRTTDEVTLTWNSSPGREYAVEFNTDLAGAIWIELDDGVQSEGSETSFTDDDPARLALPEGFYRIRQN